MREAKPPRHLNPQITLDTRKLEYRVIGFVLLSFLYGMIYTCISIISYHLSFFSIYPFSYCLIIVYYRISLYISLAGMEYIYYLSALYTCKRILT